MQEIKYGRNYDYKIKLLKDRSFTYIGDRYYHPIGLEIWCEDILKIEDNEFEKLVNYLIREIIELQEIINSRLVGWMNIIEETKETGKFFVRE